MEENQRTGEGKRSKVVINMVKLQNIINFFKSNINSDFVSRSPPVIGRQACSFQPILSVRMNDFHHRDVNNNSFYHSDGNFQYDYFREMKLQSDTNAHMLCSGQIYCIVLATDRV